MCGQRQADLLDDLLNGGEDRAALVGHSGDRPPYHQADGEVGQVGRDVLAEDPRVEEAHGRDHDRGADSEPEGSDDRAPVPLAYVLPAQDAP